MVKNICFGLLLGVSGVNCFAAPIESQHMVMKDPAGAIRDIYYENQEGYPVAEGDIILTSHLKKTKLFTSIINNIAGSSWPNGVIPFVFDASLPIEQKQVIKDAMMLWQHQATIQFIEINNLSDSQYVDYIYIQPVAGTTCSSEVGKKGGKQLINLSSRCNTMSIAHELGHTLGLWHEQSRQDRDQYVQIVWDNIKAGHQSNFNQHLTDGLDYGPYNYDSLMHYSACAFSKNVTCATAENEGSAQKTILPFRDGVYIGQRDHISQGDIDAIKAIYG
ncbi:MAG: M12 family metallopeptidase [Tatlockia sp.]|nr:M12 family metallopeptidase [Tatlockia sp.]